MNFDPDDLSAEQLHMGSALAQVSLALTTALDALIEAIPPRQVLHEYIGLADITLRNADPDDKLPYRFFVERNRAIARQLFVFMAGMAQADDALVAKYGKDMFRNIPDLIADCKRA